MSTRPPPLPAPNDPASDTPQREPAGNTDTALGAADAADVCEVTEVADDDEFEEVEEERRSLGQILHGAASFGISLLVHLVAMLLLAWLTVPSADQIKIAELQAVFSPILEDEPVEFLLEKQTPLLTDPATTLFSSAPAVATVEAVRGSESVPQLDSRVLEQAAEEARFDELRVEHPLASAPTFERMIKAVPDGEFKGDPRAIVDDYQQAMDRITQELLWKMDRGPVLVIWVFDQSGSMKDDQREIRQRVNQVYSQLGLVGRERGKYLETSVVSFGKGYATHTQRPTSSIEEIRSAIAAVPEDPSGFEYMCQAVGTAISQHRDYARSSARQMVLILVSDESGERDDNRLNLERVIAEAKAARCTIYVLGREAVFGYPHAYIRWEHPQTRDIHWLQIDRGPETAFVEQLQTDGFRRRYDAFPAGFGPYEQCRMARETGGVFFMLPSVESNLVRGESRRYDLEIMRPYRPDLRSREEALKDRDRYPLRSIIWQCIYDLDPLQRPQLRKQIEMRVSFSPVYEEFVRQARQEQTKARAYLTYLAQVQKALEQGAHHRQQEADPRWQGNYDLIYAQLVAYQARMWEYGAALEAFIQKPKVVPLTKEPDLRLVHWDIAVRKETRTKESKAYIDRASELFRQAMENHPGTPWAARAGIELKRGFGVDFSPDYWPSYRGKYDGPKSDLIPIPKL